MQKSAAAAALTCLPRDVLASILIGLPASDLRRFRHVCKEWRDTISDPLFVATHMVHGPRVPPTHTVVFYPGRAGDKEQPRVNGGGFLFDEQWRLTARFTVGESVDMIGTCKGLLCFRDRLQGVINVVEPFGGESVALPLPSQEAAGTCSTRAYCFGFDATSRRYKIVYAIFDAAASAAQKQELQVFTVGADKDWRTVSFSSAVHGVSYDFPVCGNGGGGVYWHSKAAGSAMKKNNVRFDLATENITSAQRQVDGRRPEGTIYCRSALWMPSRFSIGIKWFGEWEDGCWPHKVNVVAHHVYLVAPLPDGRRLPGPHALQRGHLLMQEEDGALRAQRIDASDGNRLCVWLNVQSKLLVEIGSKDDDDDPPAPGERRNQFVPVRRGGQLLTKEITAAIGEKCDISTFAYIPTVAPTPFAVYLGMPLEDMCNL